MSVLEGGSGIGWLGPRAGDLTFGPEVTRPGPESSLEARGPSLWLDIKHWRRACVQGTGRDGRSIPFWALPGYPAFALEMLPGCMSQGAEDGIARLGNGRALSSADRSLGFVVVTAPFSTLPLHLMHKAKFDLISWIKCLINLMFNIQAEAFPPQHIY